jgi:hypothetical protein
MLKSQFDDIVAEKIERIKELSEKKAEYYATDKDRLHNFKRTGRVRDETPEKALMGMLVKHWVIILDTIDKINEGKRFDYDTFNDAINDNLVYSILLYALIEEQLNRNNDEPLPKASQRKKKR